MSSAPFSSPAEHLAAELAWARLLLDAHAHTGPAARAIDAASSQKVAHHRELIEGRLAATMAEASALPWCEVREQYSLRPPLSEVVMLYLLAAVDARFATRMRAAWAPTGELQPLCFVLRLLDAPLEACLACRRELAAERRLVRDGLVSIRFARDRPGDLLAGGLLLAPALVDHLLGVPLTSTCHDAAARWEQPSEGLDHPAIGPALADQVRGALVVCGHPSKLVLTGEVGAGKLDVARGVARELHLPLLVIDLDALARRGEALDALLRDALVPAHLVACLTVLAADGPEPSGLPWTLLDELRIPMVMALEAMEGEHLAALGSFVEVPVPVLDGTGRERVWRACWPPRLGPTDESVLNAVAHAHPLTSDEIRTATRLLAMRHRRRGQAVPTAQEIGAAAQRVRRPNFHGLARGVTSPFTWRDMVLSPELERELRELVAFGRHQAFLLERWGMASILPYGRGVSCLLAGPPGTGKTMATSVIAGELGTPLYMVDLSRVVDKYVGETEKRLAAIFDEAQQSGALLLFDEADALFTKRTTVHSSVDRYANLEVNFLLQRIEAFDGVVILTTNFEEGLDEALKRRLRFVIRFSMPSPDERTRLWQIMIPAELPRDVDIDWGALGDGFELSGAHIKNAVVRAAARAADEGRRPVTEQDLRAAAVSEYRHLGRVVRSVRGAHEE